MTMQAVSLSALEASTATPRRRIDHKTIERFAARVRAQGGASRASNAVVDRVHARELDNKVERAAHDLLTLFPRCERWR
jgi:hypothetical protein